MRTWKILLMLTMSAMLFASTACDEAAEEAIEAATGLDFEFNEDETDVDTPDGWNFLFGVTLDENQAKLIDQEFSVDVSLLEELVDLDGIDQMIAFAKRSALEGYGNRLRYANKLVIDDKKLKLDSEALDMLGDSIGSSGEGMYIAYFAKEQNGYISGEVADCDGNKKEGILAVASDGPFFTYTADNGSWALPTLSGKPATISFTEGEDCAGSTSDPSTDTGDDPNPKDEDETPPSDDFDDGTDNVDAGEDDMDDSGGDGSTSGDCIDLASGWSATGECFLSGVSSDDYANLFPDGSGGEYLYATSSGSQVASCTLTTTVDVPSGASSLRATYNFLSQEWEEWAGSAYNDIFTVYIQGGPDPLVNRTVNNTADALDWADYGEAVLGIETSADAGFNATGEVYDGQLKPAEGGEGVRGEPEDDNVGHSASAPLPEGFTTVTIIVTVSDVGDKIYDSAGLIDSLCFE
ncbi:MAG: choice-of-anchor L domain-containing protein [Deltaproteobacteria bacterium]|nr:choice-of-anchor L domain-containing protein [Deltaproteobacteria bacterium]